MTLVATQIIPAKAGIHFATVKSQWTPRLRGNELVLWKLLPIS
jgi:hypothetical protein